ncbi:MAG TPA: mechanosensitive ion channel family protein [Burkholderiales bacterium]|nr:mechanosensitive ion channel family protein [Burkholderiales bacterium]
MGLDDEATLAATRLGRIAIILLVAWLLQFVAARLIRTFRKVMARRTTAPDELRRIDTVGTAIRYFATVVVTLVAGMLILNELGISIAPILATAGVAGVAIGFGAQSLIRDYFTGFFLLLEDQVREGDVVEIAGKGGLVEEVTLRYVRLRDMEGHVHYVPNGEIKLVTNRTRGFATPVVDIPVAYREDPREVLAVMVETAAAMRADPVWQARIVQDLEVIGMDRWEDSSVVLRARFKVIPPIEQWNVKREYLLRLKQAFDARGIEIPFPHLTLYAGQLKDGSSPALPLALRKDS